MNNKWKLLTLTALLSASSTAMAGEGAHVGGYDDDAYFGETTSYAESLYQGNGDDQFANEAAFEQAYENDRDIASVNDYVDPALQPVAYVGDSQGYHTSAPRQQVQARTASYDMGCNSGDCGSSAVGSGMTSDCGCSSTSCGSSCGTSCGGSCGCSGGGRRPMGNLLGRGTDAWMTAEALLWFPQARSTPALVTTNAAGALPELDQGATVAFGGDDAFGDALAAGFRIDGGRMLSSDFGVGGRFWMLGEQEDTYSNAGDGTTGSIGVPFFDLDLANGQENSIKVAYDDALDGAGDPGVNADFAGNISVRNTFDVYGAEGYGKLKLLSGRGFRTDFLGGFSHFGIDESLGLTLNATQTDNVGNQQFDVYQFIDNIEAENRFFGGQIGFLTSVNRGGWNLSALTKVHLGDMEQSLTGSGLRTRTVGGAIVDNGAGGIFTTDTVGTVTENEFVFAPEANIKLSYQFRPHVSFSVGYSFIMWNDIVTVGDNLDRVVNAGALVNTGGGFDASERQVRDTFNTRSFYVHGIDLGAVVKF